VDNTATRSTSAPFEELRVIANGEVPAMDNAILAATAILKRVPAVDGTDERIIAFLTKQGPQPLSGIARHVSLSNPATATRLRKLVRMNPPLVRRSQRGVYGLANWRALNFQRERSWAFRTGSSGPMTRNTADRSGAWWVGEDQLRISAVPAEVPRCADGSKVSLASVYRWSLRGLNGVRLRRYRSGGAWCTTKQEVARWQFALTSVSS
jgi:hypothetical protein